MSAIAVYPPDASDPEIVYLQRDPHAPTSLQDLSSISSLATTIPSGPPPPIPRKSSRRGLRLSIVPESEPIASVESPGGTSTDSPTSPTDLPSGSSATSYSSSSHDALERAIKQLEGCQVGGARPPSYSSVDDAPAIPKRSSSRATRESRTSSTSSARFSDVPPEYQAEAPEGHPLDPLNALTLTATEKEALKASLRDDEADAELSREGSIYSMNMTDHLPDSTSPSSGGKVLRIHARGMHPIRLPLPSKELSILITNTDDTLAYTSTRAKRSSPNFTLSTPEGGDVLRTTYDRQATLTSLRPDGTPLRPFAISGKAIRRWQSFRLPDSDGREFEWRYATTRNARGRKEERLVLMQKTPSAELQAPPARSNSESSETSLEKEKVAVAAKLDDVKRLFPPPLPRRRSESNLKRRMSMRRSVSTPSGILAAARATAPKGGKVASQRVLARLVRDDDAFTQHLKGSRGYARAGEGGDLVLEPGCAELVPEEVVVATALVMMKKEQDRLRAVQAAVIVAAIL